MKFKVYHSPAFAADAIRLDLERVGAELIALPSLREIPADDAIGIVPTPLAADGDALAAAPPRRSSSRSASKERRRRSSPTSICTCRRPVRPACCGKPSAAPRSTRATGARRNGSPTG
jgi:hypothetical protein